MNTNPSIPPQSKAGNPFLLLLNPINGHKSLNSTLKQSRESISPPFKPHKRTQNPFYPQFGPRIGDTNPHFLTLHLKQPPKKPLFPFSPYLLSLFPHPAMGIPIFLCSNPKNDPAHRKPPFNFISTPNLGWGSPFFFPHHTPKPGAPQNWCPCAPKTPFSTLFSLNFTPKCI